MNELKRKIVGYSNGVLTLPIYMCFLLKDV